MTTTTTTTATAATTAATAATTAATTADSPAIPTALPAQPRGRARLVQFRSLVLAGASLAGLATSVGVVATAPGASAAAAPLATEVAAPATATATGDLVGVDLATSTRRTVAFAGSGDLADAAGVEQVAMPKIRLSVVDPELERTSKIIGVDNRVQVANTTAYPFRATVLLYDSATGARCSGFLIGPSTVATAAHCVFSDRTRSWWSMSTLRAYPGYDGKGGSGPYGSCGVRNLMTTTAWTSSVLAGTPNWDHDFGAVALSCTVGNTTGWFGLSTGGTAVGSTLRTAGYPGDKPFTQWYTTGQVTQAFTNQLHTSMDIIGGQSGSPAYRNLTGGSFASAIVSWEPLSSASYNGLNRITSTKISWFTSWKSY